MKVRFDDVPIGEKFIFRNRYLIKIHPVNELIVICVNIRILWRNAVIMNGSRKGELATIDGDLEVKTVD